MERTFFGLIFVIVLVAGIIYLQIRLSKNKNKWLGLIIPMMFVIYSILMVFSMAAFNSIKTTEKVYDEYGNLVEENVSEEIVNKASTKEIVLQSAYVLFISNIPTYVLLGIYAACRDKYRKENQLNIMNVQDL